MKPDISLRNDITMIQENVSARTKATAPPIGNEVDDDFRPYCPHCRIVVPLNHVEYGDGEEWYLCNMCDNLYLSDEVVWNDSDDPFNEFGEP